LLQKEFKLTVMLPKMNKRLLPPTDWGEFLVFWVFGC